MNKIVLILLFIMSQVCVFASTVSFQNNSFAISNISDRVSVTNYSFSDSYLIKHAKEKKIDNVTMNNDFFNVAKVADSPIEDWDLEAVLKPCKNKFAYDACVVLATSTAEGYLLATCMPLGGAFTPSGIACFAITAVGLAAAIVICYETWCK